MSFKILLINENIYYNIKLEHYTNTRLKLI